MFASPGLPGRMMICWWFLTRRGLSSGPAWTVASPCTMEMTVRLSPARITACRPRITALAREVSYSIVLPATSLLVETPITPRSR